MPNIIKVPIFAQVIPVVRWPDGSVQNDSTFVLMSAEERFPARPILPSDPLAAFLALLLEDLFDEWGTKVMFGMRWLTKRDQVMSHHGPHWASQQLIG